jgi:ATP-dependent DNA helicase RecG
VPIDSDYSKLIDSISRPLKFAAKDDFAHLQSIKGLEGFIVNLSSQKSVKAVLKDDLARLARLFKGFDSAGPDDRRARLVSAIALLDSLKSPADAAHARAALDHESSIKKLSTKLTDLDGIGPALGEKFAGKGLSTVEDMLYFLPIRYEDRQNARKISELLPGEPGLTSGEVLATGETRYGRRRVFEAAVSDGTGILMAKWFHYRPGYMQKLYSHGRKLLLYGSVTFYGGRKEMIHPEVEFLDDAGTDKAPASGIVPVYSQIENLRPRTLRRHVRAVVDAHARHAVGCVPKRVLDKMGFMPLSDAVTEAHMATEGASEKSALLARKSIVFDELFSLELGLALKRKNIAREGGIAFTVDAGGGKEPLYKRLIKALPFSLTDAQLRALSDIERDMRAPHPMNRLIQGDVGSGKTIVSLLSALMAVEDGYQAVIMAPTEILAEQHYINIKKLVEPLGIEPLYLVGGATKSKRAAALDMAADGTAAIIVGTHALIQKDVTFKRLGLAVIDEQHRFGVIQRGLLKKMGPGVAPDVLVMTATPIPRTLAMTIFGDMDVSVIDELPPGRSPIYTRIVRDKDRLRAYKLIKDEIKAGGQVYIVYPLVEESEELSLKDATNMKEQLEREVFVEHRIGLVHGRMKAAEKEAVMKAFKARELDILVATTVIEVGVDVPGATVMVIEHAERFGLAQLHQLRGRVGRGTRRAICLLMAEWTGSEDAYKRLKIMEETTDGFRIAEEDLKLRGPGDFIGTRQSGLPDFRLKETLSDLTILKAAREEALEFFKSDARLESLEARVALAVLKSRWTQRLELAEVG